MNTSEVMNADVRVVGRWIALGFRWWIEELSDIFRGASARVGAWQAKVGPDSTLSWLHHGAPSAAPRPGARVDVILPPAAALRRTVILPPLSKADLRRVVRTDIDRLTPFSEEAVWFAERTLQGEAGAKRRVEIAVLPRVDAADVLTAVERAGVRPARLLVSDEGASGAPPFDFLPIIRREDVAPVARRRAALVWCAFGLLLVANIAGLIGRDIAQTRALRDAVEAQRATAALAGGLRRRVQDEEARRAALIARRDRQEPLRILEAVTLALPQGQWVQRLEWNGRNLRLVGYKQPGFDMAAALRGSPVLTNPRSIATELPPASSGGEPFDVIAEPERRR